MSQIKYHYSRRLKQKLKENIESVFKNFYVFVDYMDVVDKDVCILIREAGETISTDNIGYPRTQERTMDVEIIIYIKSNDRIKDKIDNYKYLMETALFADYEKVKLDNLCDYVELRSIQHDMIVDREKEIMALFYSINIKYQLDEQKPDELLI